jgi:integrase
MAPEGFDESEAVAVRCAVSRTMENLLPIRSAGDISGVAGRLHVVPLSEAALSGICVVPRAGRLLFPSQADPECEGSFSGWTKAKARLDLAGGLADWRLHDLRRTAATGMARLGVSPPIIERILNHSTSSAGPLAKVYQRYDYAKEKREALNAWAMEVLRIVR